jgi:hypothetical protein
MQIPRLPHAEFKRQSERLDAGPRPPTNWSKIARCTAVAIGLTFMVAAGVYLMTRIFLFAL